MKNHLINEFIQFEDYRWLYMMKKPIPGQPENGEGSITFSGRSVHEQTYEKVAHRNSIGLCPPRGKRGRVQVRNHCLQGG